MPLQHQNSGTPGSNQHLYKGPSVSESFFHQARSKLRGLASTVTSLGQKRPLMTPMAAMFETDGTLKEGLVPAELKVTSLIPTKTIPSFGLIQNIEVLTQTDGYVVARMKTAEGTSTFRAMRVVDVNEPLFTAPGPKTDTIILRNVHFSSTNTRPLTVSENASTVSKLAAALTQKLAEHPLLNDQVGALVTLNEGFEVGKQQMECFIKQCPVTLQRAIDGLKNMSSKEAYPTKFVEALKGAMMQQTPGVQLLLGEYIAKHIVTTGSTEDSQLKTYAVFMGLGGMTMPGTKSAQEALRSVVKNGLETGSIKAFASALQCNPETIEEECQTVIATAHHGPEFSVTILPVKELKGHKDGYAFLMNRLAMSKKAAGASLTPQESLTTAGATSKAPAQAKAPA